MEIKYQSSASLEMMKNTETASELRHMKEVLKTAQMCQCVGQSQDSLVSIIWDFIKFYIYVYKMNILQISLLFPFLNI